ncbi:MAG: PqiC family protein [Desulfobacterales bacterium]
MRRPLTMLLITAAACGLMLAACVGKSMPTTYYTLSAIEPAPGETPQALPAGEVSIGIGPVVFPDELDRQRIVTRSGRNRLEINEFHRWGGTLEANFSRVLAENVSLLLRNNKVVAQPWERYFEPDFRVVMDVRRFDGRLGEFASLNATWMIRKAGVQKPLVVRQTIVQEAIAAEGYDALVAAQSAAAATLSREIAAVLQKQIAAKP